MFQSMASTQQQHTDLDDTITDKAELTHKLHEMAGHTQHQQLEFPKPDHFFYISKAQQCLDNLLKIMNKSDDPQNSELVANRFSDCESEDACLAGVRRVSELAASAEATFANYMKDLENSISSLTQENRDISALLRSALAEKEAASKSKGSGGGILQKVGFGYKFPLALPFPFPEKTSSPSDNQQHDAEEEVTVASTMESIMKSTREEITQLRNSLEASRAEVDHLRKLLVCRDEDLARNMLRVKELEEREITLSENVEGLIKHIAVVEEDINRWRQACQLEAEAGKAVMEECQAEISSLKLELEETQSSLNHANNRLKLKENLVIAAMAARDAAERSLRLADSRAATFRERIEEMTRQFEELDRRSEQISRVKMRYVCWPWSWSKITPIGNHRNIRHDISGEMEGLLDLPI